MSLSGIWTSKGIDKLAAQTAGGPTLTIDKIALGDGGGIVPAVLPSQSALLKEVWRGHVNAVLVEPDTPNVVTVEAVIPYSVGGFYIREWGIYDTDGDLIAVGPHAEFYKPLLAEGSGAELLERIQLPLSNAGQVSLTISSEALATRKYVDQTATAKAREEVARHDGEKGAHGGRIDELLKRNIFTTAPLTGGGSLTANRTLGINAAAAPTANFVVIRDAAGRAQVAAPAAAADIARKADVDAVAARAITVTAPLTGGGNLTANRTLGINAAAAPTANFVIMRDAAGRAQVAAPAAAGDIARKAEVDAVAARAITVTAPLTGGGNLTANRTIGINAAAAPTANFVIMRDAAGRAQVTAPVAAADIARKADVDAVREEKYDLCQYCWFEDDMPRAGFFSCLGGVVQNFAKKYPKAAAYFNTTYGKKRLVTQAQYDAMHVAIWHTCADGTKIGWNGIGGVNKFVWDKTADTLRLPDLAGMTPEAIGYDSLGVGEVRGDAARQIYGVTAYQGTSTYESGACVTVQVQYQVYNMLGGYHTGVALGIDSAAITPTGPRNHGPRWISDARVYLGVLSL